MSKSKSLSLKVLIYFLLVLGLIGGGSILYYSLSPKTEKEIYEKAMGKVFKHNLKTASPKAKRDFTSKKYGYELYLGQSGRLTENEADQIFNGIENLRTAVSSNAPSEVALLTIFPFKIQTERNPISKDEFIERYPEIFTSAVKDAILNRNRISNNCLRKGADYCIPFYYSDEWDGLEGEIDFKIVDSKPMLLDVYW